jgi:RNase P subunit RPR2
MTETLNEGSLKQENNKMTSERIKKLSDMAVEDIKRANARLEELQDACSHKDKKVEMMTNSILQNVCQNCYKVIGYPTQQEIKDAGYNIPM